MPQLDVTQWPPQLFWLAVTFFALYAIVSRMIIPGVGGAIAARRARIEGDLAAAVNLKGETDKALSDYEAAIAAAKTQALSVERQNREALNADSERARQALDGELGAKIAEAETAIAATKTRALGEVRALAADIAADIVNALTGTRANPVALAAAVDQAQKAS